MADRKAKNRDQEHDNARTRDTADEYDRDLERDNERASERHTMADLAGGGSEGPVGRDADAGMTRSRRDDRATDQGEYPQHSRKGQAESPVEDTHYEPPKHKEGHGTPKLNR